MKPKTWSCRNAQRVPKRSCTASREMTLTLPPASSVRIAEALQGGLEPGLDQARRSFRGGAHARAPTGDGSRARAERARCILSHDIRSGRRTGS